MAHENSGITLLELLISMSIVAILGGVSARVLTVALDSLNYCQSQKETTQGACWALDRIVNKAGASNRLLLPLRSSVTGNVLAFSAMIDTDKDGMIEEDPGDDITGDGMPGILGIDDDGDGWIDEGGSWKRRNDDEDSHRDEDPVDGQDNDGDTLIDEDPGGDINGDGMPGIAGRDDDGDGLIDEGGPSMKDDDDEDGLKDEDPIEYWLYYLDPNGCLMERYYMNAQAEVLLEGVTTFQVVKTVSSANISGVYLTLGVTSSSDGEEVLLKTLVYLIP